MLCFMAKKSREKTVMVAVRLDEETMADLKNLEDAVGPGVPQPRPVAIRRAIKMAAAALGEK